MSKTLILPVIIIIISLMMIVLSLSSTFGLDSLAKDTPFQRPFSWKHPLGTDEFGYDLLQKLIASSRAYLAPCLIASGLTLCFGTLLGCISGYYTPSVGMKGYYQSLDQHIAGLLHLAFNKFIQYIFYLIESLPQLALILLGCLVISTRISADSSNTFDPYMHWIAISLGLMGAMKLGNIIRNQIISLRRETFIEAAVELGLTDMKIIWRHLLKTRLKFPIVSHLFHVCAEVIFTETTLRFLFHTIGVKHSWGKMLVDAKMWIFNKQVVRHLGSDPIHLWWLWFFPALIICLNIIAFYLLAEAFSPNLTQKSM